ncbi:MAG TPA: efflux transporter outer membrane subunit [Rhodocyclaceae bacterium]|uniref:efflux transporter outer membrane subunit n=1 Tax=Zoogloea sp. TaxID=49181 RepID=UPI002CDB9E24|nr:efflux transporter outer membrane subunit [Zoogloea sp.]HMV62542.1 efflux transporter outer membrane subunit [Rhodocyclaceae bacterium]HMZ77078.1 efflux transporter outer membrane subunit [Rhodocyclaceae bacterium]HNA68178.1 efflux transporter outer membrane subunit [Rhodocyclaceae bacterium]HNC79637.1 efflux transporter outer membrane subunit [Rhodocyclaceae bacterium]HNF61719.1 efflux transporter outer membrane subunit [Rhodocyclaceae bacterium]
MKTCLRPLPVILVVLLSACRIGPDYVRPEMAVPTVYKEAGDWKPAAPADPAAGDAWWTAFGDPVLDQLQARLLVSNQNLRAVEAQYRQARALADSARASGFPTVTGSVGMTRGTSGSSVSSTASQGPAAVTNSYSLGASSSWEADVWGRIARNVEAADARVEASDADLAAARLSARATLAQTYFQLRSAERQKRLLEATVAAYERALELTRNRYAAGVAGRADVVQAESLLRSTRAQTIDVRLSRAQYEHAIAVLIGEAPAAFTLAESDAPLPVAVTPVSLPSTLLERRPDIAAAERRVAAANAAVGAAQAARFPVLGLTAGAGYRSSDLSELLSLSSRYWSLGPTVAASLFDGGAKRAATGQAVAVWDQAVATYRQTVLTAFQEVEDNLVAARLLEHELTEQNAAVTAAAEAEAIALNQYRAGTVSYLNVVTAQTTLLTARRSANDLAARRLLAAVLLAKNAGGDVARSAKPAP